MLEFHRPIAGAVKAKEGYRLSWQGVALMGILNLTPDSFADGGRYMGLEPALVHAKKMLAEGALILDIGGESTRPGAAPVPAEEELDRVLPVIRKLSGETEAVLSIDTRKPEVAEAALEAGATLVNDVSGLGDPAMLALCVRMGAPAVIMHMQGEPRTMQRHPHYEDVTAEVFGFLKCQAEQALAAGVPSVLLDPGLGFGKTVAHNLILIRHLDILTAYGYPVLVGASRKNTINRLADVPDPDARDPGTLALHLFAASKGAAMLRVHNVAAHAQALKVWEAVSG